MADNYIERQYEQYEARKAAWEKKRKQGKKKTISIKLQPKDQMCRRDRIITTVKT